MIIKKVEIFPVTLSQKAAFSGGEKALGTTLGSWTVCRYVILKVHTDEGLVGISETPPWINVSREGQSSIVAIIRDYLGPIIVGKNPFNTEAIWAEMDRVCPGNASAKNAIDIALYDIMARSFNTPIYNLIGGKVREKIPLTGLVGLAGSIKEMVDYGEWWAAQGYRTIRFKIGMGLRKDEELIKTARKALGEEIRIRVDANQIYSPHEAVKVIRALEKYDIEAVEQPIVWYDFKGLSFINKSVVTPVMPHESLYDIHDVVRLIEEDAVGLFGLKIDRPGGITNAKKAIALAELHDIPCCIISSLDLGISTAGSMQIAGTLKKLDFACEATGQVLIEDDIVKEEICIENGFAIVPNKPGVGVEIDDAKLNKYSEGKVVVEEGAEIKS